MKKGASKEQNRALISSQHLQVKRSWENPGVYAWGSNSGKVAAPESQEAFTKTAKRIPFFDDLILRDLKLDRDFGAAILENGDLVQWGKAYSEETTTPELTLTGQDLKSLAVSRDRVIALSRSGTVYSIPASKSDQQTGPKMTESSWLPFAGGPAKISYRKLTPANNDKIADISGGLEHVLLRTSAGKVYTAASASEDFPSRGQLGIPGLTWQTRPAGAYDMCHEITTLRGFNIAKIAAGDYHSLVLDSEGRIFSFGDNSSGQLCFDYNSESPYVDAPSLVPINRLYQGANQSTKVTGIFAGGTNTFLTVEATRVASLGQDQDVSSYRQGLGRITADTFAAGQGIRGSLGNGRWTHIQGTPTKIPALSGLFEYDEKKNTAIPIRMSQISVGSTHASAVMNNVTYLDASEKSSEHDTNWGADVLFWGGNEYFQLGTGRRNNAANPVYIRPLDMDSEIEAGRKEEHRFHVTPRHRVKIGGRNVEIEQRVECGRFVTAVYSAVAKV